MKVANGQEGESIIDTVASEGSRFSATPNQMIRQTTGAVQPARVNGRDNSL